MHKKKHEEEQHNIFNQQKHDVQDAINTPQTLFPGVAYRMGTPAVQPFSGSPVQQQTDECTIQQNQRSYITK
jgi:hypothetical protein